MVTNYITRTTAQNLAELAVSGELYRDWYARANDSIVATGFDSEVFAYVLAVTSPRISVAVNVRVACEIMLFPEKRDLARPGNRPSGLMCRNWERAVVGMRDCAVRQNLRNRTRQGLKTSAFYRNLLGDLFPVVLDVWMAGAFRQPAIQTSYVAYRQAAEVITDISSELGWLPAETQSAIWHSYAFANGRRTMGDFGTLIRSTTFNLTGVGNVR